MPDPVSAAMAEGTARAGRRSRSRGILAPWVGAVLLVAIAGAPRLRADFHVAPAGDDAAPGTEARPFATLERARTAVRELKSAGRLPASGLTVWIRGGDHVRTNAFELTAADSGEAGAPVVWRGDPDGRARLLGGRVLTGFRPVTDEAVRARFEDSARSRIVELDLRAAGIRDFGEMKSRGFGRPTAPSHCELFRGGQPMTLARWPNEGAFETLAGFPEATGRGDDHGGRIGDLPGGFHYAGDRPRRWKEMRDLWVHGYWAWDWANSYEQVASLDPDRRLITTAPPHGLYGFRRGQRFYFLNVLEELDQPGEWFLDRTRGTLYFWPPAEAEPGAGAGETVLSLLAEPLVRIAGASQVVFRGLTFEATRGSGFEVRGGSGVRIESCVLRNLGNHGVEISGGREHGVVACDVFDTGDGGVTLSGGDRQTLTPAGHFVENCHFRGQGRWSKCYVPAVHLQGVGMRASNNLIHDHPHCAILYGGNEHLMEFNEIHHIALETGDVGALYAGRDYTFRGNRIRHNYVHHTGGVGMGSMGAYMDDCVSGTEISGNIFYRVQRAAFLGGGRDHRVVNNVFVDCDHAVELDGRGLDPSPVWRGMVDRTMRDRLSDVPLDRYRERYPEMRSLDAHYGPPGGPALAGEAFHGVPPENNWVARNVCVGKWLRVGWRAKPEMLRLENNLTDRDPRFVETPGDRSSAADFALRPDSPAWALGFERIPVERMGLVDDARRRALPGAARR